MIEKTQTIPWGRFSEKHKVYIKNALKNALNVAEGAIRSGKTIDHCIIAAAYLETCKDKIHLASGSSQPNAKLNIGECNGFGLEHLFRGRCKWGKFKDNEALFIKTQTGEKVVIFAGGGKADSYKKILGNSYGLWIATEINEHYDSENSRESFIKVAMGRQLAAQEPLMLWDLNPCKPKHPIYENYIDKWLGNYPGGYQYQLFTIYDNLTLSEERRKQIEEKYEVGSIWYKRDILGQRVQAEGLVFPTLATDETPWLIKPNELPVRYQYVEAGLDIGGNGSAYAMTCTAQGYDGIQYKLKAEKRQAEDMAMDDIEKFVNEFCADVEKKYNVHIDMINSDHIDAIINSLNDNTKYSVEKAYKPPLEDRVFVYSKLLATNRVKFVDGMCDDLIEEMQNLVFDDKSDKPIPQDNGEMQIDTWDSNIYSESSYWHYIEV